MRLALQNKASMHGTQSQVFRNRGHSITKHTVHYGYNSSTKKMLCVYIQMRQLIKLTINCKNVNQLIVKTPLHRAYDDIL